MNTLSLYRRLAFVRYLSLNDKQVVPRHHYFAIHQELSLRKQTKKLRSEQSSETLNEMANVAESYQNHDLFRIKSKI